MGRPIKPCTVVDHSQYDQTIYNNQKLAEFHKWHKVVYGCDAGDRATWTLQVAYSIINGLELPAPVISPVRKVVWAKTDELIRQITSSLERIAA